VRRWEGCECGSGTRRRPIGLDYAAAKDAENGKKEVEKVGSSEGVSGNGRQFDKTVNLRLK
jgi:hypothetical protein